MVTEITTREVPYSITGYFQVEGDTFHQSNTQIKGIANK